LVRKKEKLLDVLTRYPGLLVAFSGGVDSAFLLVMAHEVLKDRVTAVTIQSPLHPQREVRFAAEFSAKRNIRHSIIQVDAFKDENFRRNPPERCYFCKKLMINELRHLGRELGIVHIAHGANLDDLDDYRPGMQAARELNLIAPLITAGLNKQEIRWLSREMGLETWDKPAMACLATRIPCATPITLQALAMIESAENVLWDLNIRACRVRHHGNIARIEVNPAEFEKIMLPEVRSNIIESFKSIGFRFVALDLEGYVPGSMNLDHLR
jgi:uncharacterized protein